jgi:hypothetical protein
MPILYSCHPRSKKRLEATGFKLDPRVRVNEPLGFNDYNIINLSDTGDLVTVMWASEMLDKNRPDTFFEKV